MLLRAAVAPPLSTLFPFSSSSQIITLSNRHLSPYIRLSSSLPFSKPLPLLAPIGVSPPCTSALPSSSSSSSSSPLATISPFVRAEWEAILKGWICSIVAICCLSHAAPRLGRLPSFLSEIRSPHLLREGAVLVALAFAHSAATYLQQAFLLEAATRSVYGLRVHVFDRILQRDLSFFDGKNGVLAGDIARRLTSEAADVSDALYALLNMTVPNTLQFVVMAIQMVSISPMLSLMAALAIPCIMFAIAYLGEALRKLSRKASLRSAKLSAYLNEVLPSVIAVKANTGESKESMRFQRLAQDSQLQQLKKRKMKALIPELIQALYVGGLLALCACSMVLSGNSYDCSSFLSFGTALMLLIEPVKGFGKAYNELKQGEPALERLYDLARFDLKVAEKLDAIDLDYVGGDIKLCGVTFRYVDDMSNVLDGVNLHIRPGERIALVGPSGGGKSTLGKLLLRLYDPQCGSILIDNHDIRDIKLRSLRKHIVLVSQESMLFSGTIAENIAYRDSSGQINLEKVKTAAKIANADEFIVMLAQGYGTNIGERGSILSGGQKQRLAIARALYEEAPILILDEATSALDSRSEFLVRQALERLMDNHTDSSKKTGLKSPIVLSMLSPIVLSMLPNSCCGLPLYYNPPVLVIAHRLETIQMADRVVVLDGGKLTEITKLSFLKRGGHWDSHLLSELTV